MSEGSKKKEKVVINKAIYLQFAGKEISIEEIEKAISENYESVKKGEDQAEDIKIYLKPEDRKAYYVINCDYAGEVDILSE